MPIDETNSLPIINYGGDDNYLEMGNDGLITFQGVGPLVPLPPTNDGITWDVYNIGGYMSVNFLPDLLFTIPSGTTGEIIDINTTIPIDFDYFDPIGFPNVLHLNNDGISSGRRKVGMLVYVAETNKVYQFSFENYLQLYSDALSSGALYEFYSEFTYPTDPPGTREIITSIECNTSTPEGIAFVNAWTGNTI
jgi:hypothetical protein